MAHHSLDLEGITTLLPISYFINGDKDYIEITNPNISSDHPSYEFCFFVGS
jgi:hypothetical protein